MTVKATSPKIHPAFRLNGLSYASAEELLNFADDLKLEGDSHEVSMGEFLEQWLDFSPAVEVETSGSTGEPKSISLLKEHMINSAKATGAYFKAGPGTSALLCMLPDYIAGKMMLVRAMVLGWDLHVVAPEKDALTQYDNAYDFVAMVPYQLKHSLNALQKVRKLIIGGAAVSPQLEEQLQQVDTEIFATYGMTETVTHVAVRRLNGFARTSTFTALPGVKFSQDERGCLVIHADKITHGAVITNDLVELESATSFKWVGRIDNVINSGGVKVHPESVENVLSDYIKLPFIVTSEPDDDLGERVILVVEHAEGTDIPDISEGFQKLSKYERPKRLFTLSRFPYTKTGKIKRGDVKQVLQNYK